MSATAAIRAFALRRRLGGLGLLPSLGIALVPAAIALVIGLRGSTDPVDDYLRYVVPLCLSFVLPFIAMFTTLPVLGEFYEKGAVGYLLTRPTPRWALPLGMFQGSVLAMLPVTLVVGLVPAVLLAVMGQPTEPQAWTAAAAGVTGTLVVATLVDVAICVLLGIWSRRSILWAMFFLLMWGSVVGNLPGALRGASPHRYLGALLRKWGNIPPSVDLIVLPYDPAPPSPALSLTVLGAFVVACLFLGWRAARRRDIL
jgi:ABC-2 type transport system permease protein